MLSALVRRDFSARYRKSILGPAWAILQPLLLASLLLVLHSVISIPSDGKPYALFALAATVPWSFLSTAIILSGVSITNNAAVVKKTGIRREVFPLAAVTLALFDLIAGFSILLLLLALYSYPLTAQLLWLLPIVGTLYMLALSFGLIFSSLATYKTDFTLAAPFFMQFWMYVTPVIYPVSSIPSQYRWLMYINPATGLIEGFRSVLLSAKSPDLVLLACSFLGASLMLVLGMLMFRVFSQYFADIL